MARYLRVDVTTAPRASVTTIALSGDIDLSGAAALHRTAEEIARAAPSTVYVDLAAATFAGSALLTFLVEVRRAIGDEAQMFLRRPSPLIRRLIDVTGVDTILTIDPISDIEIRNPGR